MADVSGLITENQKEGIVERISDWMQPFYKSPIWTGIYWTFLLIDSFIAIPQLIRVFVAGEIKGLSLETFSAAAAFGVFLILLGIKQKDSIMILGGIIGMTLNSAIVIVAILKGVRYF